MIKKIISSGQTGVGQTALDAAIKLEFPYGGWISKANPIKQPNHYIWYSLR
ncbi:YpsA SLOG family protein [Thermodesulfobacteriota bacterium]